MLPGAMSLEYTLNGKMLLPSMRCRCSRCWSVDAERHEGDNVSKGQGTLFTVDSLDGYLDDEPAAAIHSAIKDRDQTVIESSKGRCGAGGTGGRATMEALLEAFGARLPSRI